MTMLNPFRLTQRLILKKIKPIQIALLFSTVPIFVAVPAKALELDPPGRVSGNAALSPEVGNEKAAADNPNSRPYLTEEKSLSSGLWSFGFGVGFISDNAPSDYLKANFDRLDGP